MLKLKNALSTVSVGAFLALMHAKQALALNIGTNTVRALEISDDSLSDIISNIVKVILIAVGVLAVLYLIYGGVMYLTAGGEAEKASKGRTAITNAIIGIIIIMLSLAIYNFVTMGVGQGVVN